MRPLVLVVAGAALGLAMALPAARELALDRGAPVTVQVAPQAPGRAGPSPGVAGTGAAPPAAAGRGSRPERAAVVTATGPKVVTPYGPVQVRVVVRAGTIVSAEALRLPNADGESRSINGVAGPRLEAAVLAAQSAQVDTVTGATWTSDGYRRSLQAALDAARSAAARPGTTR